MCDGPLALALRNAGEGLLEGGIGQRPSMRNPQAQQAGRVDVGMAGQVSHSGRGTGDGCAQECREPGCTTICHYGPQGGSKQHCALHRVDGEGLLYGICQEAGCSATASYGPQGGTVQFCSAHAAGGLVNQLGLTPRNKAKVGDSAHAARLAEVAANEARKEAQKLTKLVTKKRKVIPG